MKITASGTELEVPSGCTIETLLSILGESPRHDMVVEINRVFVHAKAYSSTVIKEGDDVEMLYLSFGG